VVEPPPVEVRARQATRSGGSARAASGSAHWEMLASARRSLGAARSPLARCARAGGLTPSASHQVLHTKCFAESAWQKSVRPHAWSL